jgi:hypothetical protein
LVSISFADDRYIFGLQASDLIASIVRLEVRRTLVHTPYDYQPLFEALKKPVERHERVWDLSIATGTKENLRTLAEDFKVEFEKALKKSLQEQTTRKKKTTTGRRQNRK